MVTESFFIPRDQADLTRSQPQTKAMRAAWAYAFTAPRQGWFNHQPGAPMSYSEFTVLGYPRMTSAPSVGKYRNLWAAAVKAKAVLPVAPGDHVYISHSAYIEFFLDNKTRGIRSPGDSRRARAHGNTGRIHPNRRKPRNQP